MSAKQSGLGAKFLVGGYDISGDVQALDQVQVSKALIDVTDITQSAHARLSGLQDGHMAFTVFMDTANAHPVLDTLPTSDVQMMALMPSTSHAQAIGNPAACMVAKQVGYDPTRTAAGDLTLKVLGEGNAFALEWGEALTAGLRTDTSATVGTYQDDGAATNFGAQAYLQVTAFTGTDVTIAVQHSTDHATWSNLITFTQVTSAPGTQRATVSNVTTVDRYLTVTTTTSGGFTSVTFAVVVNRNLAAGVRF